MKVLRPLVVLVVLGAVALGLFGCSEDKGADEAATADQLFAQGSAYLEHSMAGVNPEELEDAELEKAMKELGIADEPVTPEDLGETSASAPAAAPPAAAPAPESSGYIAELEKLASLRDAGVLTNEEFDAKKRQILGL